MPTQQLSSPRSLTVTPASHSFSALASISLGSLLLVWDSSPCLDPSLAVSSQVLSESSLALACYLQWPLKGLSS